MRTTLAAAFAACLVTGLALPAIGQDPPAESNGGSPAAEPPSACAFCGAWALEPDATVALQDVPLRHATLVYEAVQSLTFEMAFAPEGTACVNVARRGERAVESIEWTLVGAEGDGWRVRNVPVSGAAKEMVLAVDEQGRLVLRQPARMDEPLVFTRLAGAEVAQAWCTERAQRLTAANEEGAQ